MQMTATSIMGDMTTNEEVKGREMIGETVANDEVKNEKKKLFFF